MTAPTSAIATLLLPLLVLADPLGSDPARVEFDGPRTVLADRDVTFTIELFGIATADLDGDNDLDIVAADARNDGVIVLLGDGGFVPRSPAAIRVSRQPREIAIADFDEDGFLDAATASNGARAVTVGRNSGGGDFERALVLSAPADGLTVLRLGPDTHPDIVSTGRPERAVYVFRNRGHDHLDSRAGNVNAAAGPVADVLFVNGSRGAGRERLVCLGPSDPVTVRLEAPPSRAGRPGTDYALYGVLWTPRIASAEPAPFGLGLTAFPTPLNRGKALVTWNTFPQAGRFLALGPADLPSGRAPADVFTDANGLGVLVDFTLQGFIVDPLAPNGKAAVTNGVVVSIR